MFLTKKSSCRRTVRTYVDSGCDKIENSSDFPPPYFFPLLLVFFWVTDMRRMIGFLCFLRLFFRGPCLKEEEFFHWFENVNKIHNTVSCIKLYGRCS